MSLPLMKVSILVGKVQVMPVVLHLRLSMELK